jgi:Raf kinase inhibitor-like YbhB/YbcL family protein
MTRRSLISPSSAFFVSVFTGLSLLAACSSEEGDDDGAAGQGGSSAGTAGSAPKGGSSSGTSGSGGTTGGTATGGAGTGGGGTTGGAGKGGGGTAGSSAGSAGSAGTTGGAGGATGGASAGGAGGTTGGASGGGAGGALGGAGSGGTTGGASGSAGSAGTAGAGGSGSGEFTLTSPAFEHHPDCAGDVRDPCEAFPTENVQYMNGGNTSPELNWTGVPAGTMSFAVVLVDLSLPQSPFAHWVLWNIPGDATGLPANVAKDSAMPSNVAGAQQASLGSGAEDHGYFGPGSDCNAYQFVLYALSVDTFSPNQATNQTQVRTQLEALDDEILGTAELSGRSNHMMMCPTDAERN